MPIPVVPLPGRRACLVSAAAWLVAAPARAQEPYPNRPITLWVPWPAGGATDATLRLLAEIAGTHLRQRVQVENRPGAGGTLAMPILQQAEPDGYTIAQVPQPVLRVAHVQKVLWDPLRDVTPILRVSGTTFGVLVPAGSAFRSVDDLFAAARARPDELTVATNGVGTTPHVVLEELFGARGLRWIHVPYKGAAEQMLALETGQVMAGVSSGFAPSVESGRVRLLATLSGRRSARWPQTPTLTELGIPVAATSPYGLGGPRGLPPAIVATLHDAFRRAVFDPRFTAEIARFDQELDYLGPADYARWMRDESAREKAAAERMGPPR